jgi:hypothetical protein
MQWRASAVAGLLALVLATVRAPVLHAQEPAAPARQAEAAESRLTPYKARYQVSYRGISGGQIESSLRKGSAPGLWMFESRPFPNLLGRVAISPDARQRSTMEVSGTTVRPLQLVFDDGSDSGVKDVSATFDWPSGHVRGESKGKAFELDVPPGTQDPASVQPAMLAALLAGLEPQGFRILNGARLETYRYWPEGRATVVTPYGQFEAVIWASQRDGSKRVNRVWHAPALGYLPVQAIQYNKGRPDVQMKLVALER